MASKVATMSAAKKEPLVRIVRRETIPLWQNIMHRVISVVLALIVSGLFIVAISGENPINVYGAIFRGAFGTPTKAWVTARDTMMLLCVAVGLAPAFKMKFWNIGAEGQILAGGIATAACLIYLKDLPPVLLFLCIIVSSALAGAIWGLLPALFKSRWNTNETLFTLMMNYVSIQLTSFFVAMWENPKGSNKVGVINPDTKAGWLPQLFGEGSRDYMINVIIVMIITVAMFIYLKYTKQGYEIAVVGDSENTARYAGISVKKVFIRTMIISGAICGLSGFLAVSGSSHTISTNTGGGRGFTAIIVAWLAKFNTFTMILISLLIVFLEKGAIQIASDYNLSNDVSNVITGIILFFILGSEFFCNYNLVFRRSSSKEAE